jgi:prolyl 4-hydroxylase
MKNDGAAKSIPGITPGSTHVFYKERKIGISLTMDLPKLVVFQEFLTNEECNQLIELANSRLIRSNTVDSSTGELKPHPSRTSSGMFFRRGENELIKDIEQRISEIINWPVENGEGLQVLHYENNQRYLPHNDYFDESSPGTHPILARGGNRVGTFLMYLETPEEGGSTSFPTAGIKVHAIKGNAVFFCYPEPNADTKTLHGGDPVTLGEKYVATKWLRQGEFK